MKLLKNLFTALILFIIAGFVVGLCSLVGMVMVALIKVFGTLAVFVTLTVGLSIVIWLAWISYDRD